MFVISTSGSSIAPNAGIDAWCLRQHKQLSGTKHRVKGPDLLKGKS